jgi:DNA-binding NtrC family response regulator
MLASTLTILVIIPDSGEKKKFVSFLEKAYSCIVLPLSKAKAFFESAHRSIDVVILDLEDSNSELVKMLISEMKDINVVPSLVVTSESKEIGNAVECLKYGASDYLVLPEQEDHMDWLIEKCASNLDVASTIEDIIRLQSELKGYVRRDSEKKLKCLITEDEVGLRTILGKVLGKYFEVFEAENGESAHAVLEQYPDMDLLILDIGLPDISGAELLPQLKAKVPNLAVVVLTAFKDLDLAIKCMKLGANDFINKPYRKEELLHRARKALQAEFIKELVPQHEKEIVEVSLSEKQKLDIVNHIARRKLVLEEPLLVLDIARFFPDILAKEPDINREISREEIEDGMLLLIESYRQNLQ